MDRLFRFFAIAECRVDDASSLQARSQATVSCSQPGNSNRGCLSPTSSSGLPITLKSHFVFLLLYVSQRCLSLSEGVCGGSDDGGESNNDRWRLVGWLDVGVSRQVSRWDHLKIAETTASTTVMRAGRTHLDCTIDIVLLVLLLVLLLFLLLLLSSSSSSSSLSFPLT